MAQATAGTTYELGGPEVLTFKELMEFVLATIERKRLLVPLPFALARLQAQVLQFLPKPPLTPDQVEMLRGDNVVSRGRPRPKGARSKGLGIDADDDRVDRAVVSLALPPHRPVPAAARPRRPSADQREPDQAERADDDPPPGEQREAVACT